MCSGSKWNQGACAEMSKLLRSYERDSDCNMMIWRDCNATDSSKKVSSGISSSNILSLGQRAKHRRAKHRLMVPCGVMLSPCELAWPWEPVGTCYFWTRLFLWIPCAFFLVVNPIQRRGFSLKIPRLDNCWPNKVNLIIIKLIFAWDLACKTG